MKRLILLASTCLAATVTGCEGATYWLVTALPADRVATLVESLIGYFEAVSVPV